MPFTPPTYDELYAQIKAQLEREGFNHWAEGSKIAAICRVFAAYMRDQWLTLADLDAQSNPSTARGAYLDRLGEMFGVKRLPPQTASTLGRGPAVKFTNTGSTATTIPGGTRVWNTDDPDLAFFTLQSIALLAGAEGFADVIAGAAGDPFNVGVGVLNSHNAGMGQTTVTNVRPIGGGTFFESDDSYRFRISQALQTRDGATEAAIRQALLTLPGVRDAIIKGGVRGNGSLDVTLIPIDRYPSQALMDAAENLVADTVAAGISWRVAPPKTRRVDVTVSLRLAGGATLTDVRAQVEGALRGYLDNLRVNDGGDGSDLIYNELVTRVQDAHPDILDSAVNLTVEGIPSLQTNVATRPGERLVSGAITVR